MFIPLELLFSGSFPPLRVCLGLAAGRVAGTMCIGAHVCGEACGCEASLPMAPFPDLHVPHELLRPKMPPLFVDTCSLLTLLLMSAHSLSFLHPQLTQSLLGEPLVPRHEGSRGGQQGDGLASHHLAFQPQRRVFSPGWVSCDWTS